MVARQLEGHVPVRTREREEPSADGAPDDAQAVDPGRERLAVEREPQRCCPVCIEHVRRQGDAGLTRVEAIIAARAEKGPFTSFRDFMSKVPAVVCNKRTIESLIKGGAFDGLGEPRMGLLQVHEEYVDAFVAVKRQEAIGQDSLFGSFGDDSGGDSGGDLMGLASVPGDPIC